MEVNGCRGQSDEYFGVTNYENAGPNPSPPYLVDVDIGRLEPGCSEGTTLRRPRLPFAQDHNRLAQSTALFRSGARFSPRMQSARRDPRVSASRGTRSGMRDGALGHRARVRSAH